jgi:hypothetical protein
MIWASHSIVKAAAQKATLTIAMTGRKKLPATAIAILPIA